MRRHFWERPMVLLAIIITALALLNFSAAKEEAPAQSKPAQRLREGTRLLDIAGRFDAAGDRVNFVFADSGDSVRALENLALERISRVLAENQASPPWIVSGTITEYNGSNYLLVTKAVQAGKSPAQESPGASGIGTRPEGDYPVKGKKPVDPKKEPTSDKHP